MRNLLLATALVFVAMVLTATTVGSTVRRTAPPATLPQHPVQAGGANKVAEQHQEQAGKPTLADSQQITAENAQANAAHERDMQEENLAVNRRLADATVAYAHATVDLVAVTWVLVYAAFIAGVLQFLVLWRSVNTTRRIERPWVLPEVRANNIGEIICGVPATAFPVETIVRWAAPNHGRGPAWQTSASTAVEPIRKFGRTPRYAGRRELAPSPMPGPSEAETSMAFPCRLEKADYDAVREGKAVLAFYGVIGYRDAFGRSHTSQFCWVWECVAPLAYRFAAGGRKRWNRYT